MKDLDLIELIKFALLVSAAFFTYFKFFREGSHKQRIEFDIDLQNLGLKDSFRILEIAAIAENKGNVEQRFRSMKLKIRGIDKNGELSEIEHSKPRLAFPLKIEPILEMIPSKYEYFFVRPKVKQRFPAVVKIPASWTHLQINITFNYKGSNDIHIAERTFQIE